MEAKTIFEPDYILTPYRLFKNPTIEPSDRDVYGVIYWFEHMKDGVCRASNDTLARIAGIKPRSIQNSLNRLEAAGFIRREYKDEAKRNRTAIRALLAFKYVRTTEDRQPATAPRRIDDGTTEDRAIAPRRTRVLPVSINLDKDTRPRADFDLFWEAYPVKVKKAKATEAWRKLKSAERVLCLPALAAQLAANHFRGRDGEDYFPHPTTWLNQRRWEDGVGDAKGRGVMTFDEKK